MNPDFFDGPETGGERNRWLKRAGIALGLVVAIALVVAVIRNLMTDSGPRKKTVVHQISLLKPPPPPPPKPEQKPPEPQIKKEEVKLPEPDKPPDPQPAQAEPPPGPDLGVDAQGAGTGDSFGLVGKPGGKDITTIGGGGGGNRFTWYAGIVQAEIQKILARHAELRGKEYRVVVRVWLAADGRVERAELSESSGKPDTDAVIRQSLTEMKPLPEKPPAEMPQPMRLRLTSRS